MVSLTQVDSFEELVSGVKERNEGTLFEYEHLAFENHRGFIEFLIESDREFSDSFVVGVVRSQDVRGLFNPQDMFGDFISEAFSESDVGAREVAEKPERVLHNLVARDELCQALVESDSNVTFLDGLKFARDVLKFRRNKIVGTEWGRVVDTLVEVYDFGNMSEVEAREEIEDVVRERRDGRVASMSVIGSVVGFIGDKVKDESVSEVGERAVREYADFLQRLVNVYDYQMLKEPSVGEFVVFEFPSPHSSDESDSVSIQDVFEKRNVPVDELSDDELFDILIEFEELQDELKPDRYRIVVEVTGVSEETMNGMTYSVYEYDVVEYPEAEIVGNHGIVDFNRPIRPAVQESYARATSRPSVDLVVPYPESYKADNKLDRTADPIN